MPRIVFREEFDTLAKSLNTNLEPFGHTKKHVVNARDLKNEIGHQTILKDYDDNVDVIHVLGTLNQFSGLGNVVIIQSQGYKIKTNPETSAPETPTSPLS